MELESPENGENQNGEPELRRFDNGDSFGPTQNQQFSEDIDSACSTPYVSAPSSPGHVSSGYFFSAPASPMHFVLSSSLSSNSSSAYASSSCDVSVSGSFEFEFSSRFPSNGSAAAGSMISADELFLNGQIRPMKLSSHLQRPQFLAPLLDLEVEDEEDEDEEDEESKDEKDLELVKAEHSVVVRGRDLRLRSRSLHRRARSLSPLRNASFQWDEEEHREEQEINERDLDLEQKESETPSTETTPSVSASSSRSSSSGRSSRRWVFLKDFLRSTSEGRGNSRDKFWHSLSFSPAKDRKSSSIPKDKMPLSISSKPETQKSKATEPVPAKKTVAGKPANGVAKRRRPPSPHELHYTTNRAQAEEMKKRTFLPYKQGLLGCLGFSSKGFGAMNGLARSLHPVSSR